MWPAAAALGALAALVKITTFAGVLGAAGLWTAVHWPWRGSVRDWFRAGAKPLVFLALLPLGAGLLWTRAADARKEANPLARDFLTSAALKEWNFGTWAQKTEPRTWSTIIGRSSRDAVGSAGVLFAAAALSFILAPAYRWRFWAGVGLFLAAPAVVPGEIRGRRAALRPDGAGGRNGPCSAS